jgi:hypothetical protein
VSAKRPSRLGKDDLGGDREQEELSTPIQEGSAVMDQRKFEETTGGGEELEDDTESDTKADIRYDERAGQGGWSEMDGK